MGDHAARVDTLDGRAIKRATLAVSLSTGELMNALALETSRQKHGSSFVKAGFSGAAVAPAAVTAKNETMCPTPLGRTLATRSLRPMPNECSCFDKKLPDA